MTNELNVKIETTEVLKENLGEFFYNLGMGKVFLTMTEKFRIHKEKDG